MVLVCFDVETKVHPESAEGIKGKDNNKAQLGVCAVFVCFDFETKVHPEIAEGI